MVDKTIELLGKKCSDKVTGFSGVITTVSFDLYGCCQAVIAPAADDEGNLPEGRWFDVNRLIVSDEPPVMPVPSFRDMAATPQEFQHGPAEKPCR